MTNAPRCGWLWLRWVLPARAGVRRAFGFTATAPSLLLVGLLALTGCFPFTDDPAEEKNPLIGDARAKKAAYNYQGAIESLEKALEGNPRLALAHWELGLLFCQNVNDPAAAIYHFQKLLKLRPDWRQAETARQLINVSKIELAKNVPLGPQPPAVQQQLDRLTAKVHELSNESTKLRLQNQSLQSFVQQLNFENGQLKERLRLASTPGPTTPLPTPSGPGTTNAASSPQPLTPPASGPIATPPPRPARTESTAPSPSAPKATAPTAGPRTHTVKAGETLTAIAQRYGVKIKSLVNANPNLDPKRMKVGQVLRIPES